MIRTRRMKRRRSIHSQSWFVILKRAPPMIFTILKAEVSDAKMCTKVYTYSPSRTHTRVAGPTQCKHEQLLLRLFKTKMSKRGRLSSIQSRIEICVSCRVSLAESRSPCQCSVFAKVKGGSKVRKSVLCADRAEPRQRTNREQNHCKSLMWVDNAANHDSLVPVLASLVPRQHHCNCRPECQLRASVSTRASP